MATLASLVVRIEANNANLRRTLAQSTTILRNFANEQKRFSTRSLFGGGLGASGFKAEFQAARNAINQIHRAFGAETLRIRQAFDSGLISKASMERQGRVAARQMDEAFLREHRTRLAAASHLPQDLQARLSAGILGQRPSIDPTEGFQKIANAGRSIQTVGQSLTQFITLPLVGAGVALTKFAGDFQAAMNRVGAVTELSRNQFGQVVVSIDDLRKAALDLSQVTPFDPTEIAKGLSVLGTAGLKSKEVLAGIAPAIHLATIEQIGLEEATTTLSQTFFEFDKKIPMQEIADKLVAASLRGTVTLHDLSESLKQAGTIAALSGQQLDDVLAGLVIFGQRGITASLAGTALKNTFARLVDEMPKASKALDALAKKNHVASKEFKDIHGNILPLPAILQKLADLKVPLEDLFKIFQLRAAPGVAALQQAGVKTFADLAAAIHNSSGEAERIANIQFQGFEAEVKKLGNAFKVLAVAIGDTGILSDLTDLVRRVAEFVRSLRSMDPALLKVRVETVALIAALGPLLLILGTVVQAVGLFGIAIAAGGITLAGFATFLGAGGVILVGLAALAEHFTTVFKNAIDSANAITQFTAALQTLNTTQLAVARSTVLQQKAQTEAQIKALVTKFPHLANDRFTILELKDKGFTEAQTKIKNLRALLAQLTTEGKTLNSVLLERLHRENDANQQQIDAANSLTKAQKQADNAARSSHLKEQAAEFRVMAKEANSLVASLKNADLNTKGLVDRSDQLAPKLAEAQAEIDKIQAAIKGVNPAQIDPGLLNALTALQKEVAALQLTDKSPFQVLLAQADRLAERIDLVKDAQLDANAEAAAMAPLMAQSVDLQNQLRDAAAQVGDELGRNNAFLARANRLRNQTPRATQLEKLGLGKQVGDRNFQGEAAAIGEQFAALNDQIQAALTAGNTTLANQLEKKKDELKKQAEQLTLIFQLVLKGLHVSPEESARALKEFLDLIGGANRGVDELSAKTQAAIKKIQGVIDVLSGVRRVGELLKFGAVFDGLISSAQDALAAISQIKSATTSLGKAAGVLSLVGAGVSLIQTIFGADPATKALIAANNAALRSLEAALREQKGLDFSANIGKIVGGLDLGKAFSARFTNPQTGAFEPSPDLKSSNDRIIADLNRQLAPLGLTFADLQKKAEELGIQLFDDKGQLNLNAFKALADAAALSAEALRHFSNSIDSINAQKDAITKLTTGKDLTPAETVTNQVSTFQEVAPALAKFIGAIDTTTEEGRAALRTRLLALIKAIQDGQIAAADFGKFANADELLTFINSLADNMNALDAATADAVKSMSNVPTGFKIALRRFQATAPDLVQTDTFVNAKAAATTSPASSVVAPKLDELIATTADGTNTLAALLQQLVTGVATPAAAGNSTADKQLADFLKKLGTAGAGPEGASGFAQAVAGLLGALNANTAAVAPAVQDLINVLKAMTATDAAASIRGIQESAARTAAPPVQTDVTVTTSGRHKQGDVFFTIQELNINGADKTAKEQWREMKRVAQDEAHMKFGDRRRWSEVP